jgi:EAL domain-containing protein (putative c-di-GMP-specific phosphodiesterase class I)
MTRHSIRPSTRANEGEPLTPSRRTGARGRVTDLSRIISAQSDIALAGLDLQRVVDAITRHAQSLTGSTGAVVEMLEGDDLVYWSGSGSVREHVGMRIPAEGSISGLAMASGALVHCGDAETDDRVNRGACERVGLRSALVTPLHCDGAFVGVLKVLSDRAHAYGVRQEALLQSLASFMGATLHSALEHAKLQDAMNMAAEGSRQAANALAVERDRLADLIAAGRITPVFQPILHLDSRAPVGFEALSRFPPDVPVPPGGWFEAANRLGMGVDLERACIAAIVAGVANGPPLPGYVSINISPRTLMADDLDLPDRDALGGWVLELTEHSEVSDYDALVARVKAMQARGLRIAVDDAGAGYASLRHVLRLEPDIVKLDISITRDIDRIPSHRQLTSAIMSFSREAHMALVAEGIETDSELETLVGLQVPFGQGYLLGRPLPLQ